MKKCFLLLTILLPLLAHGRHQILAPNFKSLQVILNNDWAALPVMQLGSNDVLRIGFDELSHTYHRLVYRLEPCTQTGRQQKVCLKVTG